MLRIRASRQRLLLAARELNMMCVPEGGGNGDWDLTYIVDGKQTCSRSCHSSHLWTCIGMTTLEHSFSNSVLYEDIIKLFAATGSGYTPTHIVSYGGPWGEQLVWATEDIPNDPKSVCSIGQRIGLLNLILLSLG
jgi:hypothetical protein